MTTSGNCAATAPTEACHPDSVSIKQVEAALRASQQFLNSIAASSPHWIFLFDLDSMGTTYTNRSILSDLGYPPEIAQAYSRLEAFREFMPPDEMPHLARVLDEYRLLADGQQRNDVYRLRHADGSDHWFAGCEIVFQRRSDGTVRQILGTLTDITSQKRFEESLQQRCVELTVLNRVGAICSDANSENEVLSRATIEIAGTLFPDNCGFLMLDTTRGVLVTHPSFVLSDPSVSRAEKPLGTGITGRVAQSGMIWSGDVRHEPGYLAADSRTNSELCIPLKISGDVVGVLNIESRHCHAFSAADVQLMSTVVELVGSALKRIRTEQALRESQERYRLIVDLASSFSYQATIAADHQVSYQWVGGKFAEVTGYQPDELSRMGWFGLIPADDLPALLGKIGGLRSPETDLSEAMELRILTRSGEMRWVSSVIDVVLPQSSDEPMTIYGAVLDITARKRAEEALKTTEARIQHAQKLESLGVLAGGIAHDFNNLLTSMLGYSNLALMQLPAGSPAGPMLREIEVAAERAAELTRQMLAYSGKGKFIIQEIRLDLLIEEMSKLLQTVISKKAHVRLMLEPTTIEGDPTQVRQVVMNLIINASDALQGDAGEIRIRTGVRNAGPADLASPYLIDALPPGPYAFVEVEDTGSGMNQDVLARLFDPFFSTKFTGRGLGLAAVLGIVRSHRGSIKVSSTPGRGTFFQVLFPHSVAAAHSEAPVAPDDLFAQGKGTILIVEDEPTIRTFARHVLEFAGFRVCTASDGREGLEAYFRYANEIVAVLLDLTMPRMDGLEALQQLRSQSPGLPILVMSGYSEEQFLTRALELGANGFLRKPFNPRSLVERLCRLTSPGGREREEGHL